MALAAAPLGLDGSAPQLRLAVDMEALLPTQVSAEETESMVMHAGVRVVRRCMELEGRMGVGCRWPKMTRTTV